MNPKISIKPCVLRSSLEVAEDQEFDYRETIFQNRIFFSYRHLINNPKMFNGVTDDLAIKPYIPHKSLLQ